MLKLSRKLIKVHLDFGSCLVAPFTALCHVPFSSVKIVTRAGCEEEATGKRMFLVSASCLQQKYPWKHYRNNVVSLWPTFPETASLPLLSFGVPSATGLFSAFFGRTVY